MQAEKIDLSFLLNLLDGVLEIPGRIVIMTSNFPEKLDRALIRPGRIDVIANFSKCSHETLVQMMEFFYDIVLTDEEKEEILRTSEFSISPAEMSKIMFENFGDHSGAIVKLGEIKPVEHPIIEDISVNKLEYTEEFGYQSMMHKKDYGKTFPLSAESVTYEPITVPPHMEPMNYDTHNFSPYS
jgi:hypothetical protein